MTIKSGKPAKRELAPRLGRVTQQDAEEYAAKMVALQGEFEALRERMRQRKIPDVTFDGGNVMDRVFRDAKVFIADLEHAIKLAEIRYPGTSG